MVGWIKNLKIFIRQFNIVFSFTVVEILSFGNVMDYVI